MDYGIIGNCKTCALVNSKGSIDWMCYPSFDSPSIFAKLLDESKGGTFQIIPDQKCKYNQKYLENTNILETTVTCDDYSFKIIDFMPRYKKILPNKKTKMFRRNSLIRIIEPLKGKPRVKIIFEPKLDYAKGETKVTKEDYSIVAKTSGLENDEQDIRLLTNVDFDAIINQDYVEIPQRRYFAIGENPSDMNTKHWLDVLKWTKNYWLKWVSSLIIPENNKELIIRSALTLKLLTYSETGAILAAATTSLPEEVGSERNWDYRYCWVRDAAYCADAFKKIGRDQESKKLMEFIMDIALRDDNILPLYGIRGETRHREKFLDHLDGYKGSKPVRIGNAAYLQEQHDIYGEIIDILYLYFVYYEYETKMTQKQWKFLRYLVNQIKFKWEKKDSSIWEFRGILQHYTFSKFMCFVGVDRAIRIAQHFKKDELVNEWFELREELRSDIIDNGYNQKKNAFTMFYGSDYLDASLLLMTYHDFLGKNSPLVMNTVKAVYDNLCNDYLVQRYTMTDDFGKSKSAFTICSLWLVDSLINIGEVDKAKHIFDKLMKRSNHLGLFSEDIDIETKQQAGNFPQAYTHIAIINSSILMSEWSMQRKKIDWTKVNRKKWL